MNVLLVKMSSMGDVVHTFPAITDLKAQHPECHITWCVEEAFVDIARLHGGVDTIIPIAIRRWRKGLLKRKTWQEIRAFILALRAKAYDYVLDAQGLIKSALVTKSARGVRVGYASNSAREPIASKLYNKCYSVPSVHAIQKTRMLFSKAFAYAVPEQMNYGLSVQPSAQKEKYIIFLHGTTWETKKWPTAHWRSLAEQLNQANIQVKIPWSNEKERMVAGAIAQGLPNCTVLDKMSLSALLPSLQLAKAVVSVDTGLGHLAAAFDLPVISLYGRTRTDKVGTLGAQVTHLGDAGQTCLGCSRHQCQNKASCMSKITPRMVYEALSRNI